MNMNVFLARNLLLHNKAEVWDFKTNFSILLKENLWNPIWMIVLMRKSFELNQLFVSCQLLPLYNPVTLHVYT